MVEEEKRRKRKNKKKAGKIARLAKGNKGLLDAGA